MRTKLNYQNWELYPPAGSFEIVAIYVLGPLPKTRAGRQLIVIRITSYTKRTNAIQITKMTSTQTANVFFNHGITPYRTSDSVLSNKGQQLSASFLHLYVPIFTLVNS